MTTEFGNDSELRIVIQFDPKDYPFGKLDFTIAGYGLVRASECNLSFLCVDLEVIPKYSSPKSSTILFQMDNEKIIQMWSRLKHFKNNDQELEADLKDFDKILFDSRLHFKVQPFSPFFIVGHRSEDQWMWKIWLRNSPEKVLDFQLDYEEVALTFDLASTYLRESVLD